MLNERKGVHRWGLRYFNIVEQSIQVLCLVSVDPSAFLCVPSTILRVLHERNALDYSPIKRNVQSASDEFDGVLSHSLVEIGVQLVCGWPINEKRERKAETQKMRASRAFPRLWSQRCCRD